MKLYPRQCVKALKTMTGRLQDTLHSFSNFLLDLERKIQLLKTLLFPPVLVSLWKEEKKLNESELANLVGLQ